VSEWPDFSFYFRHLGKLQPIVILAPDDIPYHTWQKVKMFDGIFFIRGTPLEETNLRRAGIIRAAKVLILADGIATASEKWVPCPFE
jgi:hypothetical protein